MIGIPTIYKNYRFRSRLEARWARMFDLLEWKWEYEPVDFNGWIPDFALYGKRIVYVEVKPVVELPEAVVDKIDASGCPNEVLIVGQTCPLPDADEFNITFGWLREQQYDPNDSDDDPTDPDCWWWDSAVFGRWSAGKGKIGFCHEWGRFDDRISGGYDGGSHGSMGAGIREIKEFWASACNVTQWKGRALQ